MFYLLHSMMTENRVYTVFPLSSLFYGIPRHCCCVMFFWKSETNTMISLGSLLILRIDCMFDFLMLFISWYGRNVWHLWRTSLPWVNTEYRKSLKKSSQFMKLMYCGVCHFEDICVYGFPCLIESFQSISIIVYVIAPIHIVFVINDFV